VPATDAMVVQRNRQGRLSTLIACASKGKRMRTRQRCVEPEKAVSRFGVCKEPAYVFFKEGQSC